MRLSVWRLDPPITFDGALCNSAVDRFGFITGVKRLNYAAVLKAGESIADRFLVTFKGCNLADAASLDLYGGAPAD